MEIYCVVLRLYAEVYGKSCFFENCVFLMYLYTLFVFSFWFPSWFIPVWTVTTRASFWVFYSVLPCVATSLTS